MRKGISMAIWILVVALGCRAAAAQEGYSIQGGRIVTQGADQWRQWLFPFGTVDIDAEGARPHFVAPELNASLNAHRFPLGADEDEKEGGILAAGSGLAGAAHILDGEVDTYWEPDLDDPQDLWWVAIDLGRIVSAKRIVLRFAQAGAGDPFYQFRLMVADGEGKVGDNLDYHLVGKTERPNVDQREFSFELQPFQSADPHFTGDAFRFVQVVMTDSRLGKAEEVDSLAYQNLPAALQGTVEYFGRSRSGSEWLLDAEAYALLDPSERGSIRYYRREQPRLAEVEVWTLGENISLGAIQRGGTVEGHGFNPTRSLDGDYTTWYGLQQSYTREAAEPERQVLFDLGALYWLDLFHFLPPAARSAGGTLGNYRMKLSDGSLAPDGSLQWVQVEERRAFRQPRFQEVRFELQKVRYIAFDYLVGRGGNRAGWSELQAYGEGYQPEVVLESPLIDLSSSRNLTTLQWEADVPPGTHIEVATRTGDQTKVNTTYYRSDGAEVDKKAYHKLISALKGDSLNVLVVDEETWSPWSKPHLRSGQVITSPSPRRFLKIQVKLSSDDPQNSVLLRRLELSFSQPWVGRALGEVFPVQVEHPGEHTPLTFFVRPVRRVGDPGIDEVLLVSSGGTPLSLREVRLGSAAEVATGGGEALGLAVVEVLETAADSLWVRLPSAVGRNEVLAVDVLTALFGHGVSFAGRVGNRDDSGTWQLVEADQETVAEVESGVLRVLVPSGQVGLSDLTLDTAVVTPNGDGANDAARIGFEVLRLDGTQAVIVSMHDLAGRRVWTLEQVRERASGQYEVVWQGVDDAGERVPPGTYILRVEVDADARRDVRTQLMQLVHVVY